jgi:Uma2 family endonuclease
MLSSHELPHYTIEDYEHWEGRWELIEGIPYAMAPAPGVTHQRVSQRIAAQLEAALEGCGACMALLPVDWRVDAQTVLQPDNLVICHRPPEAYLTRPPVLILEVLSPCTVLKDRETKFRIYEREGVRWYVLVDPELRQVKVFHWHEGRYAKYADEAEGTVEFDLGPCRLRFDFNRIWGPEKQETR